MRLPSLIPLSDPWQFDIQAIKQFGVPNDCSEKELKNLISVWAEKSKAEKIKSLVDSLLQELDFNNEYEVLEAVHRLKSPKPCYPELVAAPAAKLLGKTEGWSKRNVSRLKDILRQKFGVLPLSDR